MNNDIIKLQDELLGYFYEHRLENVTVVNIRRNFTNDEKVFLDAIQRLASANLITVSSSKVYTNPNMNLYKITGTGITVFEAGGIATANAAAVAKSEKAKEREDLELSKLRADLQNVTNQLKDYDQVKMRAKVGFGISIIAILVALATLAIKIFTGN